ncbi:uncharacterized protein METZ01_LOCUS79412, partial [marine metagenome]
MFEYYLLPNHLFAPIQFLANQIMIHFAAAPYSKSML